MTSVVLLIYLALSVKSNAQMLLKEVSLENQIEKSNMVIEGRVIGKKSFWDAHKKKILTSNTIEVYKVFKGVNHKTIEVITLGGVVGLKAEIVSPSLKLRQNDVGVFMLYNNNLELSAINKSENILFRPYGSIQGFYKYNIEDNSATNAFKKKEEINSFYEEIISFTKTKFKILASLENETHLQKKVNQSKGLSSPSAIAFTPTSSTAGTKSTITITIPGGATGTDFGAVKGKVAFSNADDGGATFVDALDSQVTWSNTLIIVEVPSSAGTGVIRVTNDDNSSIISSEELIIRYSEFNVTSDEVDPGVDVDYQVQHVDDNGSGGYTWQMFTEFDANTPAKEAFIRALETWRCETGINWTIGTTTTVDEIEADTPPVNVVRFDNGTELEDDVLGRCTFRFSGCFSSGRTTINWFVDELDIVFDDATNWNYSNDTPTAFNEYDFESVALHELGHGHQLAHVIDTTNDVMHYDISNGEEQRVLGINNITAAIGIQTRSTTINPCPFSIPSTSVMSEYSGDCNLSIDDAEFASAVSIYPNPTKGEFFIKNESYLNIDKVIIYDLSGRLISQYDINSASRIESINIQGMAKGVYLVNLHSDRANISTKLVLN